MPTGRLPGRATRALAAGCWIAAILPVAAARPATTVAAVFVSAAIAARARRAASARQRVLVLGAGAAAALAIVWGLAVEASGGATLLLALDDLLVAGAGVLALSAAAGAWTPSASALVVELPPSRHAGRPIRARLAKILGDPDLEVLYRVPGHGWVDERGQESPGPDREGRVVTRASAPAGGEAALVHGYARPQDPRLAEAAAAAAALLLDAARLDADLRGRAVEVHASRRRLLTVADAERRALEERLLEDVLSPLRRVQAVLERRSDASTVLNGLQDAMAEVVALGRGVYPPALVRGDLSAALRELADQCPGSTSVEVAGEIDGIPERLREASWFVCSEALANAARHASASRVSVRAVAGDRLLEVEVRDDGRGGASAQGGLHGLKDRVEALGGALTLDSPAGGPTVVRAAFPLSTQGLPRERSPEVQGAPR
jgi:hypothetical protein